LSRGKKFIEENIPFCKQEKWRYIKALCFGDDSGNICNGCKPFVLLFPFDVKKKSDECIKIINNQFMELWNIASTAQQDESISFFCF